MLRFQSTFPRGERRFLRGGSRLVSYFNPRSLVGNDGAEARSDSFLSISIHVPSWGTTKVHVVAADVLAISIHVPSWGTTERFSSLICCSEYFNPRSLVGNDDVLCFFCLLNAEFQSTFPRGERQGAGYMFEPGLVFQSTFPRGERLNLTQRRACFMIFQSTFPRGERLPECPDRPAIPQISIHVPSWGTTHHYDEGSLFLRFQSTFPRGERRNHCAALLLLSGFQSTFPRGERRQIFTNILCFFMQ